MKDVTLKTWTVDEIEALFRAAYAAADEANRRATAGPFNPYGEALEDLVWFGSIREAWEGEKWAALGDAVNDGREEPLTWEDYEGNKAEIEAAAIEAADTAIGSGRPLVVATYDGAFPVVFCETADEDAVREAIASFYAAG